MLLLLDGRILDSLYRFPPWPVMAIWLLMVIIMSVRGKTQIYLSLKWPWIVLLLSLACNAIWQNITE
jgi:hypothetical protein